MPTKPPLISIIVPVYNNELYLAQCLSSICAQTLSDIEIIVIDDYSQEPSRDIIRTFAQQDSRIRFIFSEKKGNPGIARNQGLAIACGEYIGFVDSDDWIEPTMYAELYTAAIQKKVPVVACGFYEITPSQTILERVSLQGERNPAEIFIEHGTAMVFCWNKLYHRSILQDVKFTISRYHEDMFFNIHVFCLTKSMYILNTPLYNYRRHAQSITSEYNFHRNRNLLYILRKCKTLLKQFNLYEHTGLLNSSYAVFLHHRYAGLLLDSFKTPGTFRFFKQQALRLHIYADNAIKASTIGTIYSPLYKLAKRLLYAGKCFYGIYLLCQLHNSLVYLREQYQRFLQITRARL
jgi:glycosyltransferase involved in cell wall biosynthesis